MSAALIETEPETRLVNCRAVHDLQIRPDRITHRPLGISDGDPERALRDAIRAKADGLLIIDVLTGERWFVDCAQVIAYDWAHQLAFVRRMDAWHRAEGHVLCYCNRWIHPDELVDETCGARECLRTLAMDNAGLVP